MSDQSSCRSGGDQTYNGGGATGGTYSSGARSGDGYGALGGTRTAGSRYTGGAGVTDASMTNGSGSARVTNGVVTLAKSASPDPYVPGARLTYAVTVANVGPAPPSRSAWRPRRRPVRRVRHRHGGEPPPRPPYRLRLSRRPRRGPRQRPPGGPHPAAGRPLILLVLADNRPHCRALAAALSKEPDGPSVPVVAIAVDETGKVRATEVASGLATCGIWRGITAGLRRRRNPPAPVPPRGAPGARVRAPYGGFPVF